MYRYFSIPRHECHVPSPARPPLSSFLALPNMFASSTPHQIKLKDGREVPCEGAPKYQEKTGYYRYRTPDKRDGVIRADDVVTIVEKRA